jgi:hypothetical protein
LYPFLHFKVSLSSSVLRLELNGGLNYPGADYIVRRITYLLDKANKSGVTVKSLVLDGSHMPEMDFAVVQVSMPVSLPVIYVLYVCRIVFLVYLHV